MFRFLHCHKVVHKVTTLSHEILFHSVTPYDLDRDLSECAFHKLTTVGIPEDRLRSACSQLAGHLLWLKFSRERITWRKIHDMLRKEDFQELSDQISEHFAGKIMVANILLGRGGGGGGLNQYSVKFHGESGHMIGANACKVKS